MRVLRHTPAVRDFHRHQQRIAGLQTHALGANFGDELTRDKDPFILLVMHVKRAPLVRMMVSWGKDKDCKAPLRVGGADNLSVKHPDGEGAR
jgi:hypothetical protein